MSRVALTFGLLSLILCFPLAQANGQGELTPELLGELRDSLKFNAATRVKHNAVTNNDIKSLALNRSILRGHDGHFSHKIDFKGITNQKSSGRCWMFAGFNTMRPQVIDDHKLPSFEFSTAYLQFWDKMEKSNLFLEEMIELRDRDHLDREWQLVHEWSVSDGGWWNYVVDLVEKYGAVPKDVMPETHSSENTRTMNLVLERKLRADAVRMHNIYRRGGSVADMRAFKKKSLKELYRFLTINLGEPPTEFVWRYEKESKKKDNDDQEKPHTVEQTDLVTAQKYTPKSFYEKFVSVPLRDYVCLYNDPVNPYQRHYHFERSKNIAGKPDMHFVNIAIDQMKSIAMKSVMANEPVWFAANVSHDQSTEHGLMASGLYSYGPLFDLDLSMTKSQRVRYMDGASNHAMVFMGVDVKEGKPVKWLVENSWGAEKGKKGTWTLLNNWFDDHVYVIIVHKKHVPAKTMKIFRQKPVALPAWYPGAVGVRGKGD